MFTFPPEMVLQTSIPYNYKEKLFDSFDISGIMGYVSGSVVLKMELLFQISQIKWLLIVC